MSDIVDRLRSWVYTDALYATAREAADEIERLRSLRDEDGKAMHYAKSRRASRHAARPAGATVESARG